MNYVNIENALVGENNSTFIIAEISANHNGSIEKAIELIREVKKTGADAVKLQTYTANTITLECDKEYFQINKGTLWDGTTLHKLYKDAYTPWGWHKKLFEVAKEEGLICFSSPFDKTAVDFLEELAVPAYKIASFEINDIPLIEYVASKMKPIIISTGIATLSEIEEAINACKRMENEDIILLKCTSAYPAPYEEMNLKTIPNMKKVFGMNTGLSDHSMGSEVAIAAVALGATVVEKHITLDRNDKGPDSEFSMEPQEFKEMVAAIRNVEKALGKVSYTLSEKSIKNKSFSRSLFIVEDVKKGEIITERNVRSIRPNDGMHTRYYSQILGKTFNEDLEKGTPMDFKYVN